MELQSANLSELMPELIQAISQLGNLSKDKQGYGYKYAELSKVLDTCRPILAEHNLVITQLVTVLNDEPTLVTTLFHKSGQFYGAVIHWLRLELSKLTMLNKLVQPLPMHVVTP